MKIAEKPKIPVIIPISVPLAPIEAAYKGNVGNKKWKPAKSNPLAPTNDIKFLVHNFIFDIIPFLSLT